MLRIRKKSQLVIEYDNMNKMSDSECVSLAFEMQPLLGRRQAVRPAVVGVIVAGLVGVVALSMLVGHSSTTVLLQPGYIMLDDFQPWRVSTDLIFFSCISHSSLSLSLSLSRQAFRSFSLFQIPTTERLIYSHSLSRQAPPWDDRVGQGVGGGSWYDQAGTFYGSAPGSQQKAVVVQALAQEPNWEGLDSKLRRKEKLASMHEEVSVVFRLQIEQNLCFTRVYETICAQVLGKHSYLHRRRKATRLSPRSSCT